MYACRRKGCALKKRNGRCSIFVHSEPGPRLTVPEQHCPRYEAAEAIVVSETLTKVAKVIKDAAYAMVAGNLDGDPVPRAVVDAWLRSIEEALQKPLREKA